jgi:aconitate hydratase
MDSIMSAWDSIGCQRTLNLDGRVYTYFSLPDAEKNGLAGIARLPFSLMPFSLKVLLENLLRFEDGQSVTRTSRRVSA